MPPALQKLAALGAYAVSAGLFALFAFLCWLMWPTRTAGMNATVLAVGILCAAIPLGIMIAVHVVLARQLEAAARRPS
jgi:TRAP-type C4-dicarboxylate transport system permease small subunit